MPSPFRTSSSLEPAGAWVIWWRWTGLILACLAGSFLWSVYFYARSALSGESTAYPKFLVAGIVVFSYWIAAAPLVSRIAERLTFDSAHRWRNGLFHLALSAGFMILHAGWLVVVAPASYALFGWDTWSAYWARLTTVETFFNVRGPIDIAIYWGILFGTYGRTYYRRYQERAFRASQLEAQLAQAQLAALNSRLHPHFIFNTLHSIVALVQRDDKQRAISATVGLSDMLRRILNDSGQLEITLNEEIDITRQYLAIEQIRFGDRLSVEFRIGPETQKAYVPTLILQPLVENAIRHGISEKVGPGNITLSTFRRDAMLEIEIVDNGVGISDAGYDQVGGQGLRITRDRLREMYGSEWELVLNRLPGDAGTQAVLRLPLLERPKLPTQNG